MSLQIRSDSFLSDINSLLNSGDIPNIHNTEELKGIHEAMKSVVTGDQPDNKLYAAFTKRVKNNLHVVLSMRY